MAKVDKSNLTKDEWRVIKEQRRLTKLTNNNVLNQDNVNILCLKHGSKYSAEYVNKLFYGVKLNLQKEFNFYCLTENTTALDPNIIPLSLPNETLNGWWYKPYIFSNKLPINGTILYLDLDVVITGSLDKLFSFAPKKFCIIRDFNRILRPHYDRFNSSVMRFESGMLDNLWTNFEKNSVQIIRKYFGDQDYIYAEKKGQAEYFPDQWIQSWKWEIRKNKKFAPGGLRGRRKLATIEDVTPPEDCCIAVFHGDPNPHLCDDPYIRKTWIYKE